MKQRQVERSTALLGYKTVEMLQQVHLDALWILENLGIGCKEPRILEVFKKLEDEGLAAVYEDRVYAMSELVEKCLRTVPGVDSFFVPRGSFFIGAMSFLSFF